MTNQTPSLPVRDLLDAFPNRQQLEHDIRQARSLLLDARQIIEKVVSAMPLDVKYPPSNDILLPEQEVLVNNAIVMHEGNLRLLELQNGLVKDMTTFLLSATAKCTTQIGCLRRLRSSWKILPDELWSQIFLFVTGDDRLQLPPRDIKQAPWSLIHVCYRWRRIALKEPHLWNNVIIKTSQKLFENIQLAQNMLERSQNLPLTLKYGAGYYASALPTRAHNCALISDLLIPVSKRLVSINLAVFCGKSMLDIPRNIPESFLPQLQNIDIKIQPPNRGTPSNNKVPWAVLNRFLAAPHLQRVKISVFYTAQSLDLPRPSSIPLSFPLNLHIMWQNLTTLSILYIPLSLSTVYDILAHRCSVVEELTVEILQAEPEEAFVICCAPVQTLPRLKKLELAGCPTLLFKVITTPNLLHFALGGMDFDDTVVMLQQEVPSFTDFFRRSAPPITFMVLDAYPETIDFAPVLEVCTRIEELSMREVIFPRAAMLHFTASKRWPKQFFCKVQADDLSTFKDALQEYATYLSASGIANETTALYTELEIVDISPSQQDVADELEEQLKQLYEASGWTLEF